ncbi:TPA: hypothetical protein DCW56_02900 [Candidatus Peregrinibacteria bacterium]|nr:hypothetical protein [Candidatus Peregrinibacteria bacterium]
MLVVMGLVLWQMSMQISALESQINDITQTTDQAFLATGYISDFGTDINEIRELLLLPTKDYSLIDEENTETDEEDEVITNMFKYISDVSDSIRASQVIFELDTFFNSAETKALLAEKGLSREEGNYLIKDASSIKIIEISVSDSGYCNIETYFGEVITTEGTSAEAISEFENTINNLDSIKEKINKVESARATLKTILYESGAAHDALTAKGMWTDTETDGELSFDYNLVNQDQAVLATVSLSKEDPTFITWGTSGGEKQQMDIDAIKMAELINGLNSGTILENKIAENKTKMESLLQDAGFQTALLDNGLNMSSAREDDAGISYDITDSTGAVLSTVYVDKKTGKVMVKTADGSSVMELISAVSDDFGKKKLWICPNHYLIMGVA